MYQMNKSTEKKDVTLCLKIKDVIFTAAKYSLHKKKCGLYGRRKQRSLRLMCVPVRVLKLMKLNCTRLIRAGENGTQ